MKEIKIFFDGPKEFIPKNIKPLQGVVGLYFIFAQRRVFQYPFKESRLLYIGMSEKKTNSIGYRLTNHFDGKSGNIGITNYKKNKTLLFSYINFEMMKNVWDKRIEDLESYFILDFVKHYGVYPVCNNKTGYEILKQDLSIKIKIDWKFFD